VTTEGRAVSPTAKRRSTSKRPSFRPNRPFTAHASVLKRGGRMLLRNVGVRDGTAHLLPRHFSWQYHCRLLSAPRLSLFLCDEMSLLCSEDGALSVPSICLLWPVIAALCCWIVCSAPRRGDNGANNPQRKHCALGLRLQVSRSARHVFATGLGAESARILNCNIFVTPHYFARSPFYAVWGLQSRKH
jgi:hypothetical protein